MHMRCSHLFALALALAAGAGCTSSPRLPAFPLPDGAPAPNTYPWIYYDHPDHGSVFQKFQPVEFQRFSAKAGASFSIELTAMKSATEWMPDPTKKIDGVIYEGLPDASGTVQWTALARAASHDGVLDLTGASTSADAIHLVGVEADPSSYDDSISPAVEFTEDLTCDGGSHDRCAVAPQPGEACTVSPNNCDGPFQACISPDGECGATGFCQREDVLCDGQPPVVCTCAGHEFENRCQANQAGESVRHTGSCP